jgi:hypothetical protein
MASSATHTALSNLQAKLAQPGQAQSVAAQLLTGGWLGLALTHGLPFIVDVVKDWVGTSEPTPEDVDAALSGMRKEQPLDLAALGVKDG